MDSNVRSMEIQIKSVPAMDQDSAEKAALQGKPTQKLLACRRSSVSLIDVMLNLASSSELAIKSSYLNLMKEVRERILGQTGNRQLRLRITTEAARVAEPFSILPKL